MTLESDLKPIAEGSFLKTPFAHILVFLFEKRMTGTLDVKQGAEEVVIYFRDGFPAKVSTTVKDRGLGHVMLLLELIDHGKLDACNVRMAEEGGLVGQTLVDQGAIDVKTLVRGLREQILLKLTDVFALKAGTYAFYEKINKLSGFGPDEVFPIHPYPALMAGVRAWGDHLDFEPILSKIKERWLVIDADRDTLRKFRLKAEEKKAVRALLERPMTGAVFLAGGQWQPEVARYLGYILLITKKIAIKDAEPAPKDRDGAPVMSLTSLPADAVAASEPNISELKQMIAEKAKNLAKQSYYEMLEVSPAASTESIRRAFFALSKQYHPDRVPKALGSDSKDMVAYLFSNLSEAHTVLSDPAAREEYDTARAGEDESAGDETSEEQEDEIRDILEAENLFQRAVVFLNQKKHDKARELVSDARELNPHEGEYLALESYLEFTSRPPDADVKDLVEELRRAAAKCPKSERVNVFLARILKHSGRNEEARTYFNKVLKINPHNIDAARAVRLMDIDKKGGGIKKRTSIFTRLFK
jgi:curved DNA-binding protein CbpA